MPAEPALGALRLALEPDRTPLVDAADSLAVAMLEIAVHLSGTRRELTAIVDDLPTRHVGDLGDLPDGWADDESVTAEIGRRWLDRDRIAARVPAGLVDVHSGERLG